MRVLLVEDDADMAQTLKSSLTADDHEVDVANDGETGESMALNGRSGKFGPRKITLR